MSSDEDVLEFTRQHPDVLDNVIEEAEQRGWDDLAAAGRAARRQLFGDSDERV